jgi:hypothetical protein
MKNMGYKLYAYRHLPEYHELVKTLAKDQGTSQSEIIRQAIMCLAGTLALSKREIKL